MTHDFPPFAEDHRECEYERERVEHYLGSRLDVALEELAQKEARIRELEEPWVDVNDELPRNGLPVIIGHYETTFSETAFVIGDRWYWKADEKPIADWIKITHWMLLPAAPKDKFNQSDKEDADA